MECGGQKKLMIGFVSLSKSGYMVRKSNLFLFLKLNTVVLDEFSVLVKKTYRSLV